MPDITEIYQGFLRHKALRLRPVTVNRYAELLQVTLRFLYGSNPRKALPASILSRPLLEDLYTWLREPGNLRRSPEVDRGCSRKRDRLYMPRLWWAHAGTPACSPGRTRPGDATGPMDGPEGRSEAGCSRVPSTGPWTASGGPQRPQALLRAKVAPPGWSTSGEQARSTLGERRRA
jgi:hypothetical protein